MAEHPDLGGVSVSLNAAVAAIEKNKTAIGDLEKKADQRQKKLADQEASEEQSLTREVERGKKKRAVRTQSTRAAEEESAALEAGDRTLVRQTGAVDANTAAIRRQTAAREADTRAAQAQAAANDAASYSGGKYSGAFGGTRQPAIPQAELEARAAARRPGDPTFWPAALGPRERQGFLSRKYDAPDEITQRQNYEALVGKETAERAKLDPYPGGPLGPGRRLVEGGIGDRTIATDDPKVFSKYAARAGFIKAANKTRKEAATAALAEAKAAAKVESEAVDASVPKLTAAQQRALANPSALYEESGGGFAGGVRNRSARERPYARLAELGLLEETEAAKTFSSANYARTAEGERALAAQTGAPPAPPPPPKPPVAVAPTPEEPERRRRTLAGALTPEEQYRLDQAAGPAAEARALGGTSVSLAPAAAALESKTASKAVAEAKKAAAAEEVAAQKAANTRMLEDQRTFEANSLAEAKTYARAKAAAQREASLAAFGGNAERERLAYGLGGGGGGGPKRPVAAAGAGGAGGGGDGGRKVLTDAEGNAIAEERDLNAVREKSNAILQRQVGAYASSSQALQRHGALTAEFIQALVRGEVTLKEFESQLAVTIGKFSGWAVAGGLVYGVYEGIKKLFEGITQTQSGVEQLKRALGEKVNVPAAEEGFRKLAQEVNVPIGGPDGVARAQFYAARVFHNQQQSQELAGTALRAFKLDEVNPQDAVKSFAALNVAFKSGPEALKEAFDQLDVGQLKFNARLNQTLPQVGRAAASFAAAGGTQKQLIDQIIQINRATGGGGGTGGGNPATALLREPANLTRPESEETLRRYGIDPKWARQHIGDFNQYVQELAGGRVKGQGALSESSLQELAKAAGGGAGVGFRYLLPLFRLGQGNLPAEERGATENAKGSAEEDLHHKLSQLDEQFKKLGVDFEIFGSRLGGTGIEATLGDIVSGLNLVVKGAGLVITPIAALGQALSNLPDPIRKAIEAAALIGGVKLLARSRIGQTAAELAGESSVFLKASGDPDAARKVRSVLAAQRKDEELLTGERAQVDSQARSKARAVNLAAAEEERVRQPASVVAGYSQEDNAAYQARLNQAKAKLDSAIEAQAANQTASNTIADEQLANQKLLNTLKARNVSLEKKIVAIREYEAHGVGGGAPTTAPLIYPTQIAAAREDERLGRTNPGQTTLFPVGGGAPTPPEGTPGVEGPAAVTEGTASVAAEAETLAAGTGAGLYVAADAALQKAGGKLVGAAKDIGRFGKGLGNFYTNAGLLTRGLIAFATIDIGGKLLGGDSDFEKGQSLLAGLKSPSSKGDLEKRLEQSKGVTGESTGDFLHNLAQGVQHPIAGLESIGHEFFGIGSEHPEYFSADQARKIKDEAKKKQELLLSGKLALPGTLSGTEGEEAFQGGEEVSAHELGSEDKEAVEGSKKKIEAELKLRLAQLKSFGGSGGEENIRYLARQLNALSHEFIQSGNQTAFEELIQANEAVVQGVLQNAQAKLSLADKFLTGPRDAVGRAALASSEGELNSLTGGLHQGTKEGREALHDARTNLNTALAAEAAANANKATFSFAPVNKQTSFPQPLVATYPGDAQQHEQNEAQRKEVKDQEERKRHREHETHEREQEVGIARAGLQLSHAEEGFKIPRAQAGLAEAQAGPSKARKAEIAIKLLLEEEKRLIELVKKSKLNLPALLAKQAEVTATAEDVATGRVEAHQEKLDRQNKLKIAQLPAGASASEKAAIEASGAASQLSYLKSADLSGLSKETRTKLLEEAEINNANASKTLAESSISESKEIAALDTQIAEARAEGDPEAQAAAAAAGAAREAAEAKTGADSKRAELDAIKAASQQRKAKIEEITGKGELKESREANPEEKEKTHLKTLNEELPFADKVEKRKLLADKNNTIRSLTETRVSEGQSQIDFELHTEKINNSVAIKRIDGLLKLKGLSQATRRQLESKRYDLENEQGSTDFAVTNVPQPTVESAGRLTLDNRLKASAAARGLGLPKVTSSRAQPLSDSKDVAVAANYSHLLSPQLHQVNHISVVVQGGHPGQVVNELERAFRTQTKAQLRSARLVG